jgi:PPOX class probable F420-dependent enzyme
VTDTTGTSVLPQGDPRLLDHPVARGLLDSTELARLAYTGRDGAPRVVPVGFVWNGAELVVATFAQSAKVAALRERPAVAVTIDRPGPPPQVLTLRGEVVVGEVGGVPHEYRLMQERYYGAAQAAAVVTELERSGARLVRLVLRPAWVGVLDFRTRFPGALGARDGAA